MRKRDETGLGILPAMRFEGESMTKRIPHNCTNCRHEYIDHLTCMPVWWCKSPNRKGRREVGYSQRSRCRIFEPKEELVTDGQT